VRPVAVRTRRNRLGPASVSPWTSNETITGEATLTLTDGTATIYGSGTGLLAFGFQEVGGERTMGPARNLDCVPHPLVADRPMASAITNSGGFSEDQPDADFYRGSRGRHDRPSVQPVVQAARDHVASPSCR